uniref:ATP synthase complex subunit 8 n=1 Tax=Ludioschema sulcicolle TaxID=2803645 RepID=A0A7T8V5V4_9COLE|nr:ATP synthase F0 subunit 8 [Ludioschema sulcicolle]QQQ88061.1 ATP synthase F0 subunit 8 [Ludioschema sulcicolle]
MPQMAPLSWINLFILFIITYMILNSLNYFSFTYNNKTSSTSLKSKKINWKW